MKNRIISFSLWFLAVILMLVLAVYQRMTGPTNPIRGSITLQGETYRYKLPRSANVGQDAVFEMHLPEGTKTVFRHKRFKSHDDWTVDTTTAKNGTLKIFIPEQIAAGKVIYQISINNNGTFVPLNDEDIVIRFKGAVPALVLIPHIILMFLAMVFGLRTGFEALFKRKNSYIFTIVTTLFFFVGGFVFGPIVQQYAFGTYWTGLPFGNDLTDNKTLIAFVFWIMTWLVLYRNKKNRIMPILATLIMLAAYLIPHSTSGSEVDFTQEENKTKTEQLP
ncbi:MAG: hypothetical protein LBM67_09450 [Lentimicrobiaceae bacterium]|jgi:hypothetical protein|nr:hypothetical protein [Lentimicrobiaceae bacterium]